MSDDQSALDRLIALVPPPAEPVFGTGSWEELTADTGVRFPADYMAFIERYGRCEFARWMAIYDPREPSKEGEWDLALWGEEYRDLRDDSPEDYPLAMWPEPGGFVAWGSTIDGETFGWLTVGEPEEWPVLVLYRLDLELGPVYESMTEFLLGWASGLRYNGRGVDNAGLPLRCLAWA
ncbi:SMI1/KNR4 family protein [Streptosporangium sp. NPDC020072]|uniref:SMI1/KNR4 family protein n=1 Tax=unclassified Streptosporangium TaxID=2632669 RepID=UPI00344486AD